MSISKLKNARKHISLLLIVMMLFSMCSVGIPAAAFEGTTSHYTRAATPTDASPTDASPTDATPTNATPTDASPTDATSTNPEEQPKTDMPKYYYDDSDIIAKLPTDYINGIMIAHYFNIMGAYDGQNNFKPNEPMKSSDVEYALKAIDSGEPTMTNFTGELLTVQALVQRIWLASGKGSYIYSAEMQRSYLNDSLGISYDENNDFANAWSFCVKNGIVTQFFDRQDFSVNLPVTRAMAAYALSNYYLWREGYDINNLTLDIPNVAPIDEEEMRKTAYVIDKDGNEGVKKLIYVIGTYNENNILRPLFLINASGEFRITQDINNTSDKQTENSTDNQTENLKQNKKQASENGFTPHTVAKTKKAKVFIRLPDWGKILHGHTNKIPLKACKKSNTDTDNDNIITFYFGNDDNLDNPEINGIGHRVLLTADKAQIESGDLNETGELDHADCGIVQNYLTGSVELDDTRLQLADIDGNSEHNLVDAYLLWEQTSSQAAAQPKQATASVNSYIKRTEAEQTQNTATTFKFIDDGDEMLNPITLDENTHFLILPENTYKKEGYSFNYWNLHIKDNENNNVIEEIGVGSYVYNITVPTDKNNEISFEANWISYDDFEYNVLDDGTAEITKYNGTETYVTIPSEISGYTVTSIGYGGFIGCTSLESITIPNSVTSIGDWTFYNCRRLASITIPDSVTSIGERAFEDCTSLESITIPNSVTSIEGSAFRGCTGLASITIPNSVKSIGYSAFEDCTSLVSITIGSRVTSIGDSAFRDCTSLASITIPDSVTSIGNSAFYNCTSLESITIPDSVTSIGNWVFSFCTGLTRVILSENSKLKTIGESAFYKCSNLSNIKIPNSVTSIGNGVFQNCISLTSITIPDSVRNIERNAFCGCISLTNITISEDLETIEGAAFGNCTGLTSITIPNSVTSIGSSAFVGCTELTILCYANSYAHTFAVENNIPYILIDDFTYEIQSDNTLVITGYRGDCTNLFIPNKIHSHIVTNIGDRAFFSRTSLTSITIPNSVKRIGELAFYNCYGLTSITIPDSVMSIGTSAFSCTAWYHNQPNGDIYLGEFYYGYKGIMPNNHTVNIKEGTVSIVGHAFFNCTSLTSITIPNSVKSIGDVAFYGCTNLTSINIPESVTSIGYQAFLNCTSLTSITIPEGVTSIGKGVFYNCTGLTSITISNRVTTLGEWVFHKCIDLTDITIPEGVKSIECYAFRDCTNLKSITIAKSVTSIHPCAFTGHCEDFTISCYANSTAENYAINNHIPYTLIAETT